MPISADTTGLFIIAESTPGVTPATPVFDTFQMTGESLSQQVTSQTSAKLNPDRATADAVVTGLSVSGDINGEVEYTVLQQLLMSGALKNNWEAAAFAIPAGPPSWWPVAVTDPGDRLRIGAVEKYFSVEKRFTRDAGAPTTYLYHRYLGCTIGSMSISMSPDNPLQVTYSLIGQELELDDAIITGATYTPYPGVSSMSPADIIEISLPALGIAAPCFGNLTINLNNNSRTINCLGGTSRSVAGLAEVTLDASVLFESNDVLELLRANGTTTMDIFVKDADDNVYRFYFPRIKVTQDNVNASGAGQDVLEELTLQATYDPTLQSSMVIGRYTT